MKNLKLLTIILCTILLNILSACGEDDVQVVTKEEINISDFQASISSVMDIGNKNTPEDVKVSLGFAIANDQINTYRIYFEKSDVNVESSDENLVALKGLGITQYTIVSATSNQRETQLKSNQQSISNEPMIVGQDYKAYVLSVANVDGTEVLALSDASSIFSLEDTRVLNINQYKATDLVLEDFGNNGHAGDFVLTFNAADTSEAVSSYWIFGSKNDLSGFTIENAKGLDPLRYRFIDSNEEVITASMDETLLDIDGNKFELGVPYQFMILTRGEFKGEEVFTLSAASNAATLVQNLETSTLVPDFRGNGSITIDDQGNLYVNEFGEGAGNAGLGTSAFKITPDGVVTELASDLSGPVGNTLDADGNYYFNNGNEGSEGDFTRLAPDGTQTIIATIDGYPTDILTGTDGNFYITNWTRPVIHQVTPEGVVTAFTGASRLSGCTGITYDDNGNILVGNFSTGLIMSIDKDGIITDIGTIPTVRQNFVIGYIDFFEGHIYATGYGSNKIYKVSMDGNVEELAGDGSLRSIDGEFDRAAFITPNGIAIDKTRRILYVSQNGNGNPEGLRAIPLD